MPYLDLTDLQAQQVHWVDVDWQPFQPQQFQQLPAPFVVHEGKVQSKDKQRE